MNIIFCLLKMNLKLLLRNKGFLFFLILVPIVSIEILNIKQEASFSQESHGKTLIEMENAEQLLVYEREYSRVTVLAFDSSWSDMSYDLLNDLSMAGIFQIYYVNTKGKSEDEIVEITKKHIDHDNIACYIYLKQEFDERILDGDIQGGITVYLTNTDEREELLVTSINERLSWMTQIAKTVNGNKEKLLAELNAINSLQPQKEIVIIDNVSKLSVEQSESMSRLGYSIAIVTFAFLYAGIFIASIAVSEKNNHVYMRIMLGGIKSSQYILAKLIVSVLVVIFQTIIMGIGLILFVQHDFGIRIANYMLLVFLLGVIFCCISLCIGIALNNIMAANYAAFSIWAISCMLAGLYFPIDSIGEVMQRIANFMPQRWTIRAAEMLIKNDNTAYPMIFFVTAAYLIVIISFGIVGLKLNQEE